MVFHKAIRYEDDPIENEVIFAVAPIDAISGRIVRSNISVSITVESEGAESTPLQLPDKPIRNLSGLLVLIKRKKDSGKDDSILPVNTKYRVHIKARTAGYFDPDPIDFTPSEPGDDFDTKNRLRLDVPLFRRPEFSFPEEVTLVSGIVVRGTDRVEGARISAIVRSDVGMGNPRPPQVFETRSDERGAFALVLRLPKFSESGENGVESDESVQVKFRVETRTNNSEWELASEWDLQIIEGRRQMFKKPIDLLVSDNQRLLTT